MMTDSEFYRLDQEQWFTEFVECEVRENFADTHAHNRIFEFDDVPY